jgi:hypothetical protein
MTIVGPTNAFFVFSLLCINSLYMLQALLAHLQEVLLQQQSVYCVCIMSAGCYQGWSSTPTLVAIVVYVVPPEDEQVVLKTC